MREKEVSTPITKNQLKTAEMTFAMITSITKIIVT